MTSAEQRKHPRLPVPIAFRGHDLLAAGELRLLGADLSQGGSFIRAELLLEPGDRLALEFQVPGLPRPMRADARVAWVRRFPRPSEPGGMGVEFLAMTEEDRAVLAQYLRSA